MEQLSRRTTYWKNREMMKNWFKSILIVVAFGFFLGACGQKGDLYLPESETATEEEEQGENTE
ncbi:MAG: lipoprotein [Acidiferrobacterales bacterium]|nr:lipoprotein [Acidiferrobacterales bacterium]